MKVGIVGCSNGQPIEWKPELDRLIAILKSLGMEAVLSPVLFEKNSVFSGSGRERAQALNAFYRDDSIREIFDISGGDLANEVIGFLDWDEIARHPKRLWGYSDLTCVLNAVWGKVGQPCMLYQVRSLLGEDAQGQIQRWKDGSLTAFRYEFLRGNEMEGTVIGGNIRCLLKLAGTPYWPDVRGKILLMEGLGTTAANAAAYIAQLDQMGVFQQVSGILLGTFTRMDAGGSRPTFAELLTETIPEGLPLAHTREVGHGADSRAVCIGKTLHLTSKRQREMP